VGDAAVEGVAEQPGELVLAELDLVAGALDAVGSGADAQERRLDAGPAEGDEVAGAGEAPDGGGGAGRGGRHDGGGPEGGGLAEELTAGEWDHRRASWMGSTPGRPAGIVPRGGTGGYEEALSSWRLRSLAP